MHLLVEKYTEQVARLPATGKHIIGQFDTERIVVYQAYKPSIADFAAEHGYLGGSEYSYTRMTWMKPNFLWMMFRSGWAAKENQERILAVSIKRIHFETILSQAVHTVYKSHLYADEAVWKRAMAASGVRVQWDPDHNPHGHPTNRRAIQLGMKGSVAQQYAKEWIENIEDITPFVYEQKKELDANGIKNLLVPKEAVYPTTGKPFVNNLFA